MEAGDGTCPEDWSIQEPVPLHVVPVWETTVEDNAGNTLEGLWKAPSEEATAAGNFCALPAIVYCVESWKASPCSRTCDYKCTGYGLLADPALYQLMFPMVSSPHWRSIALNRGNSVTGRAEGQFRRGVGGSLCSFGSSVAIWMGTPHCRGE